MSGLILISFCSYTWCTSKPISFLESPHLVLISFCRWTQRLLKPYHTPHLLFIKVNKRSCSYIIIYTFHSCFPFVSSTWQGVWMELPTSAVVVDHRVEQWHLEPPAKNLATQELKCWSEHPKKKSIKKLLNIRIGGNGEAETTKWYTRKGWY